MAIYFDFKTINELTGNNYYRQQKEFTLEDLSKYNGRNGRPAYVAIEGIVYDISNSETWGGGTHFGLTAGKDLTNQFNSCHGIIDILTNSPKVGTLIDENYMNGANGMNDMNDTNDANDMDYMANMNNMNFEYTMPKNRQVSQDKSKFTPDDWIRYIAPLVVFALREPSQGMNTQRLYQKVILLGVLVGLGKTPQEAISQVQEWQNTGASQILKSGTSAGGTGIPGSMGTGTSAGTGVGTGTTGGMGTGGSTGTGVGTGTTGGMGAGGSIGTGTTGGIGTGGTIGTGFGAGTGTSGGTSTGGSIGTGGGAGTTGGMGTGGSTGTGFGAGTGTSGGTSTGGSIGTGGAGGTTGGMGTGGSTGTGFGAGTGTSTGGSIGTGGGAGTTGGMGTGGSMGTGFGTPPEEITNTSGSTNTSDRLDLD